jgi:hypothetical protein
MGKAAACTQAVLDLIAHAIPFFEALGSNTACQEQEFRCPLERAPQEGSQKNV